MTALADAGLRALAAPVCREVVVRGDDVQPQVDTLLAAFERRLNT